MSPTAGFIRRKVSTKSMTKQVLLLLYRSQITAVKPKPLTMTLVRERRTLNLSGSQDKSTFKTTFTRLTAQHRFSSHVSLQHGFEMNLNSSAGERIQGTPHINEFAYFAVV
jgi:hypothetical protein